MRKTLTIYAVALVLGAVVGLLGSCLQLSISIISKQLERLYFFASQHAWPVTLLSAIITTSFVTTAWFMVRYFAPEASGSGVQEIEGVLLHQRTIHWKRLLPVKFIGSVLTISSKMVMGREGPTIQMGGNLGEMFGELCRFNKKRRDALIAAGAAAGLATAFNAPFAAVLFILEEMRNAFDFSFLNFKVVALACVSATIVLHAIIGAGPVIPMSVYDLPSIHSLLLFFCLGIMVGLVGLLFNISLIKSLCFMDRRSIKQRFFYVLAVGLLIGTLAKVYPSAVGAGYDIIEKSLQIYPAFSTLCLIFLLRFLTSLLSYNTGVPGGVFAPMMALGTILGLAASHAFHYVLNDISVHPGMFAVAGMGALFSAAVRAPLTGIILVVEMTQNYSLILPLMVTCLTSTTIMQLAKNPPIYTQLLNRSLKLPAGSLAN